MARSLPEEFDKDFEATPKATYRKLEAEGNQVLEVLTELDTVCNEKFKELRSILPSASQGRRRDQQRRPHSPAEEAGERARSGRGRRRRGSPAGGAGRWSTITIRFR